MAEHVDIVFDGPPGPEGNRFIEVEDAASGSVYGSSAMTAVGFSGSRRRTLRSDPSWTETRCRQPWTELLRK